MSDLCPVAVSQDFTELENQPKTSGESHLLLLKQKKYCDVVFTFPNQPDKIEAHEFCLKARSPVFEQIFRMRRSGNVQGQEIEIPGSTPEIFQQFLEFIYADKFEVDIAGALDLLQLAQKYKIQPLIEKCEDLLKTEVKVEESIKVFEAARHHGSQELMDRAGEVMVKSFRTEKLPKMGALMNAEEETVIYLLQSDELSVQEVALFEFILDWGRKQVGTCAGEQLLKAKLKHVISNIRYTNMTPLEFTTVVVSTGLLSAEETTSVYSYLCGDEGTRGDLKVDFNTTPRKKELMGKHVNFYAGQASTFLWSYPISKQSLSFKIDRKQAVTEGSPDYLLKKAAITGITFVSPIICDSHKNGTILNFSISIRQHSGSVTDKNFMLGFEEVLLNLKGGSVVISVDPPVYLLPGKTFSIIIEDLSTSNTDFRGDSTAYLGDCFANPSQQANIELEDARLVLNEIQRSTDYYSQERTNTSQDIVMIRQIATTSM